MDHPKAVSRYEVRMWPLLDRIWPRFAEVALYSTGHARVSLAQRIEALDEFRQKLDAVRKQRFGEVE